MCSLFDIGLKTYLLLPVRVFQIPDAAGTVQNSRYAHLYTGDNLISARSDALFGSEISCLVSRTQS